MKPKISIVIPYFKNKDTISKCLYHIKQQDFKDYQVIIVNDENNAKNPEKIISKAAKNSDLDCVIASYGKNMGASYARNYGANLGKSEYILFLDADCYLYPGMLRECVEQLDDNQDIDFVYGNYRFIEKNSEFIAKPFDPYLLETMNYICTMSPLRRTAFDKVKGFIDGQKFFQDWSLFYRMVKAGSQGKWINEFIFSTPLPTETSVSGSQGLTLAEKAKIFRSEHGIEDKSLVVTTLGAPLQAIQRAKMLGADYVGSNLNSRSAVYPIQYQFDNWKGTYLVGCYNSTLDALQNHLSICVGKKIIHFIGTDVFYLISKHPIEQLEVIKEVFKANKAKLFANSSRLVKELAKCGIKAELLFTPIYKIERYKPTAYPNEFSVAVYYSDSNHAHLLNGANGISNLPLIVEVARALPFIKFKFFGGKMKAIKGNIEYCGNIPEDKMSEFISSCSMYLRATIHDGFPQLPIQYMLSGRPTLVSCPDVEMMFADKLSFEEPLKNKVGFYRAKKEMIDKIRAIKEEWEGKPLNEINIWQKEVFKYYSKLLDVNKYKNRIYEVLND